MHSPWLSAIVCAVVAGSFQFVRAEHAANFSSATTTLQAWERASAGLLGVGRLEHRRLHWQHQATHSAHEIGLLNEFRGPISARQLSERFRWSHLQQAGTIQLVGTPVDDLEKLFYEEVIVELDTDTSLPKSVRFQKSGASHSTEPFAVALSPRIIEPNLFLPAETARPLQYASLDNSDLRTPSRVRLVGYVRPKPEAPHELPVDVSHALAVWELSARRIQSLQAIVRRFTYENAARVEHRAIGEFTYQPGGRVHCLLKPAQIDPKAQSVRVHADGGAYELLPSPAEHWDYTPAEIRFSHHPHEPSFVLRLNPVTSNPQQISVEESRNPRLETHRVIPPWPMLFDVSASDLAERFQVHLLKHNTLQLWRFSPRVVGDIGQFREVMVLLDSTTSLPQAVRITSSSGDVEAVYTFQYTQVLRQLADNREPQLIPVKQPVSKLDPAPTTLHGQP